MPGTVFSKIISGGQTAVDRAALDVALECGGWCAKGRRAEDGLSDPKYLSKKPNQKNINSAQKTTSGRLMEP